MRLIIDAPMLPFCCASAANSLSLKCAPGREFLGKSTDVRVPMGRRAFQGANFQHAIYTSINTLQRILRAQTSFGSPKITFLHGILMFQNPQHRHAQEFRDP